MVDLLLEFNTNNDYSQRGLIANNWNLYSKQVVDNDLRQIAPLKLKHEIVHRTTQNSQGTLHHTLSIENEFVLRMLYCTLEYVTWYARVLVLKDLWRIYFCDSTSLQLLGVGCSRIQIFRLFEWWIRLLWIDVELQLSHVECICGSFTR